MLDLMRYFSGENFNKINIDFIKSRLLNLFSNSMFLIPLGILVSCNNSNQLEKTNAGFNERPNILILM